MLTSILWFLGGGIITGICTLFAMIYRQKNRQNHTVLTLQSQLERLAENLPFAVIMRPIATLGLDAKDIFNGWVKQHFEPLETESQWQAIENQMSPDSLRNFTRMRSQLYKENRGFEMQLPLNNGQKYSVRGFYLNQPSAMHIIFFRPTADNAYQEQQAQNQLLLQNQLEKEQDKFNEMQRFYRQILDDIPYPIWFRGQSGKIHLSNKASDVLKVMAYLDTPPTDKIYEDWHISEKSLKQYKGYLGVAQRHMHPNPTTEPLLSANPALNLIPALNNINVAIALFDENQRLQWFNNRLCQMWKIPAERLANKPKFQNFFYALEEHENFRILDPQKWLSKQIGYFSEFHGTESEKLAMGDKVIEQTVLRAGNRFLAWIFEDISDNTSLRRQIQTASDVRTRVLNSMNDGLMLVSSAGRIEYVNPILGEIWNITMGFFENKPHLAGFIDEMLPLITISDTSLPQDESGWRNLLMDAHGAEGEIQLNNQAIWLYFESRRLPDGSQIIRFADRSAEKSLTQEKELRNNALQSALERMQAFIQDVSIEVRQPTGNIQGLSEMLASQRFGALNARQNEYANSLVEESRKLTSVMQDILDVASIDAGSLELDMQTVNVFNIIQAAFERIENRISRYKQKIQADIPANFSPIYADELRLKQILYSLLSMAAEYSRSPGTIHFSAHQDMDANMNGQQIFTINFSCRPHKKLHPMLKDKNKYPIEAQGQLELTDRLITLHTGQLQFAYMGDDITMRLSLPIAQ
ncbi:MAG: PAS-domain containing protein [Alphaproteobacteria bacterium]